MNRALAQKGVLVLLEKEPPPFHIGESVRLKSGGPMMTVVAMSGDFVDVLYFKGEAATSLRLPYIVLKKPGRGRRVEIKE